MKRIAIFASVLAMLVTSCAETELSGKWNILKVNGEEVVTVGEEKPFIEFNADELRVHGYTGCNIMNGAYTFDGKVLTFGNMATTMMAGPEENMKTEQAVLGAVNEAAKVKVSADTLYIMDASGNVLMELAK